MTHNRIHTTLKYRGCRGGLDLGHEGNRARGEIFPRLKTGLSPPPLSSDTTVFNITTTKVNQ